MVTARMTILGFRKLIKRWLTKGGSRAPHTFAVIEHWRRVFFSLADHDDTIQMD